MTVFCIGKRSYGYSSLVYRPLLLNAKKYRHCYLREMRRQCICDVIKDSQIVISNIYIVYWCSLWDIFCQCARSPVSGNRPVIFFLVFNTVLNSSKRIIISFFSDFKRKFVNAHLLTKRLIGVVCVCLTVLYKKSMLTFILLYLWVIGHIFYHYYFNKI